MITLNHLVRRSNTTSAADFRDYWLGDHATRSLALASSLGIKKFTKCETLHEDDANLLLQQMYGTRSDAYDFVDQMVISDLGAFKAGLADPAVCAALKSLHEQSSSYIDAAASDYWFSIDLAQVFTTQDCTATAENAFLKVFYVPRRLAHLSLQEAQLHWNSCHGAIARQYVSLQPFDRYIQGHRIESAVVNEMKDILGGQFENIDAIIGQAEAWLNRNTLPRLAGPEVERVMRMLIADIDLFVRALDSHIFATKEHVILGGNGNVISEPVPSLFNAD